MNPVLQLPGCIALFLLLVFGLGLPLAASLPATAAEKICAGAAIGVLLLYGTGLLFYGLDAPAAAYWALPLAAAVLTGARWPACRSVMGDEAARRMAISYLTATVWAVGFLALVRSYSGASWSLDWADHYDRARFFSGHWPSRHPIFGGDLLPTRPPLANVVTGTFLTLAGDRFSLFQIFTTLASSLAFLPGWLFARRFSHGSDRAPALFAVLYMLNPSILENSTFAWTKLPTVFFVLTSLYFFLPGLAASSIPRLAAAFGLLAAAFLTHYSAGPYAVALVAAYFWWRRSRWLTGAFWRETAACLLPAMALLATWFAWAMAAFGPRQTFLANTSVTQSTVRSLGDFVREKGLNLYHTLVPHPFRGVDYGFIAQASHAGYWRDYFFLLYQVNLPLIFGSGGAIVLAWISWQAWRSSAEPAFPAPPRAFWAWFVGSTVVLGTAASGGVDEWGVAHLCLQSLLGLGLAFIAARTGGLAAGWCGLLALGGAVDFVLGVGLQFFLENIPHASAELLGDGGAGLIGTYGLGTWGNLRAKVLHSLEFVGDWPVSRPLLVALLACLLGLALSRLRHVKASGLAAS